MISPSAFQRASDRFKSAVADTSAALAKMERTGLVYLLPVRGVLTLSDERIEDMDNPDFAYIRLTDTPFYIWAPDLQSGSRGIPVYRRAPLVARDDYDLVGATS
jgi:hypothetical protein